MIFGRLDLRDRVIKKFENLVTPKYKLLQTNTIFFEKEGGEISYVTCKEGYNIFVRKDGIRTFPRAIDGKEFMEIIHCLKKNKFFTYIYTDNQRCKVRPKAKK